MVAPQLTRRSLALLALVASAAALAIVPSASAGISQLQQGTEVTATNGSLPLTLSSASTAGTLLVAVLVNKSNSTFTAPSGWTNAVSHGEPCCGDIEIWYRANNPGGITSQTFTAASGSTILGELSEWSGVATSSPLDQTGVHQSSPGTKTTWSATTGSALTASGEVGITTFGTAQTGLTSLTAGSGWTHLFTDPAQGSVADYATGLASGAVASETETFNPAAQPHGIIATFKPSTCSGGSLGMTAPSSASFSAVTLNGTDQTVSTTLVLTPDDETGSGSGWNITGTSTTFNDGSGHTLSTSATSVTAASSAAGSPSCNLPTNSISYAVTLPAGSSPPTAVKLYNAATGTGKGQQNVTLTLRLSVPANAFRGTYTSTWTFAVVSGP